MQSLMFYSFYLLNSLNIIFIQWNFSFRKKNHNIKLQHHQNPIHQIVQILLTHVSNGENHSYLYSCGDIVSDRDRVLVLHSYNFQFLHVIF